MSHYLTNTCLDNINSAALGVFLSVIIVKLVSLYFAEQWVGFAVYIAMWHAVTKLFFERCKKMTIRPHHTYLILEVLL